MKPEFRVGERIFQPATPPGKYVVREMVQESPRYAEVIKVYNGAPSATDKGVPLMDVKYEDTGEVKIGCLNRIGIFDYPPLMVPTAFFPQRS